MKIEKKFEISRSRDAVWKAMGDIRLVADCLPGASITEQLDRDRYKGGFTVRLGPLAASFDGEVAIERRPEDWIAIVSGKGADTKSGSRATGSMTYRLVAIGPETSRVDVISEVNLSGALAQFGKISVVQEVANRITAEFVRNFEMRLALSNVPPGFPTAAQLPQDRSNSFNLGQLIWSIVRGRIVALIQRLFGKRNER